MRGQRANDAAPHGHWCVRTLIGSVRGDGQTTCMTIDAPTDRDVFLAYVRKILVPALRPGDIVVLDNLRSHKTPEADEAIRAAGAEVQFLPPYSPDLNPIRTFPIGWGDTLQRNARGVDRKNTAWLDFCQRGIRNFGGRPGRRFGGGCAAGSSPRAARIPSVDGFVRTRSHWPESPMRIFLARRKSDMRRE